VRLGAKVTWEPAEAPNGLLWRLGRRAWRKLIDGPIEGVGVVDFATRRYALDFGEYAALYRDGEEWGGRPDGTPKAPDAEARPVVLWLVESLASVVRATEVEPVGEPGRFVATIDLRDAAERILATSVRREAVDELRAATADVHVNDGLIEFLALSATHHTYALHLSCHGDSLEGLDWSTLPRLKSLDSTGC
jgi:hypothetical protein